MAGLNRRPLRYKHNALTNWANGAQCLTIPLVPTVGLEPTTTRLKVLRSTDWAKRADVARLSDKWNLTMNYWREILFLPIYDSGGIWTREAFIAQDLKSYPIDRTRGRCLNATLMGDFLLPERETFCSLKGRLYPWRDSNPQPSD